MIYMQTLSRQETGLTGTDGIGLADGLAGNGLRGRLLAGAAGLAGAERLWSRRRRFLASMATSLN